jgi:acetylornithine deacetylase/succinyl-diaminopimelate desuccinylase-like protein
LSVEKIRTHIERNRQKHTSRIQELLRQPSVASEDYGMEDCAELLQNYLRHIGFSDVMAIEVNRAPEVYGRIDAGAKKTLIVYNMYDTASAGKQEDWTAPPFEAELVEIPNEGKAVVARGAEVRKGALMAFLNALESIIAVDGKLPVNIRFVAEGEETLGSPNFQSFVEKNRGLFDGSDSVFWPSCGVDAQGDVRITLGAKGMLGFELECTGQSWGRGPTDIALHGADKAIVDSPLFRMVQAIATMTDRSGNKVLVEGFYENATEPSGEDLRLTDELLTRCDLSELQRSLKVRVFVDGLSGRDLMVKYLFSPVFHLGGIIAGKVTPIPAVPKKVTALFHCRIVPNMTGEEVLEKVKRHLEKQGFPDISVRPLYQLPWIKTRLDDSCVQALVHTYEEFGCKPQIWPGNPTTPPPAVFGLPYVSGGYGKGGRRGLPNEYLIVEGLGKTPGIMELETSFVSFLYKFSRY